MDVIAIIAALGVFIVASPAFFFLGRKIGGGAERERQTAAKATAQAQPELKPKRTRDSFFQILRLA